jgi:hypothetical protein
MMSRTADLMILNVSLLSLESKGGRMDLSRIQGLSVVGRLRVIYFICLSFLAKVKLDAHDSSLFRSSSLLVQEPRGLDDDGGRGHHARRRLIHATYEVVRRRRNFKIQKAVLSRFRFRCVFVIPNSHSL